MLSFISGKKEAPFTFNGKCQEKSKMWLIVSKVVHLSLKVLIVVWYLNTSCTFKR
jgi:hypothetical protein